MRNTRRQRDQRQWENHPAFRFLPLFAAVAVMVALGIGAATRDAPPPIAVFGVFLVIGGMATLAAWRRPVAGALFVTILAIVVVTVLYII